MITSVFLSIFPLIFPSIFLSIFLFISSFPSTVPSFFSPVFSLIFPLIFLSTLKLFSTYPFICLSANLSIYPSTHLSFHLFFYLSNILSRVQMSFHFHIYNYKSPYLFLLTSITFPSLSFSILSLFFLYLFNQSPVLKFIIIIFFLPLSSYLLFIPISTDCLLSLCFSISTIVLSFITLFLDIAEHFDHCSI